MCVAGVARERRLTPRETLLGLERPLVELNSSDDDLMASLFSTEGGRPVRRLPPQGKNNSDDSCEFARP